MTATPRVLLLDNYDSFTYNLAQLAGRLGADVHVVRNDAITLEEAQDHDPTHIIVSPGPGHPANPRDFGVCGSVIRKMSPGVPTLGVCLGLQGLAHVHGAKVVHAPHLVHGKASPVHHEATGLFQGLPEPFQAGRYHSLVVDPSTLPASLEVTATGPDGEIMGLRHRTQPLLGVQFHPESILTPDGPTLLRNFLEMTP